MKKRYQDPVQEQRLSVCVFERKHKLVILKELKRRRRRKKKIRYKNYLYKITKVAFALFPTTDSNAPSLLSNSAIFVDF